MLCIGVGVINRVQNEIMKAPLFWLSIIDAMVSPLQGFLNRYTKLEGDSNSLKYRVWNEQKTSGTMV